VYVSIVSQAKVGKKCTSLYEYTRASTLKTNKQKKKEPQSVVAYEPKYELVEVNIGSF